jgi:sterol desaturase/sphingolipid hydroxylase (fatty acid hydroxylase superfamily)
MQTAYKSIRLFKSPFFEWFSHIHPLTPLVVWAPVTVWNLWQAFETDGFRLPEVLGIGLLALLTWSLTEYALHRFVFHFEPKGEWLERLHFIMHGIHHADPVDPTRLVMPPPVSIVLSLMLYPLFLAVVGPRWIHPFFAFFIAGYLAYDYIHYAVHHFTPRTRLGKQLKQSHMIHHYVNHQLRWGVSSPLWDVVFGTFNEPKPVRKGAAKGKPGAAPGLATEGASSAQSARAAVKQG